MRKTLHLRTTQRNTIRLKISKDSVLCCCKFRKCVCAFVLKKLSLCSSCSKGNTRKPKNYLKQYLLRKPHYFSFLLPILHFLNNLFPINYFPALLPVKILKKFTRYLHKCCESAVSMVSAWVSATKEILTKSDWKSIC